jgi:hypothetical protein
VRVLTYVARTGTAGRAGARLRRGCLSIASATRTIVTQMTVRRSSGVILIPHFLCPRPSAAAEPIGSLRTSDVIEIAHSASNKCTGRRGRRFGCGLAHRKSRKPRRALPETRRGSHCRLHIGVLRARSLARHPLANGQCTPAVLARLPPHGAIDIVECPMNPQRGGHVPEDQNSRAFSLGRLTHLMKRPFFFDVQSLPLDQGMVRYPAPVSQRAAS